MYGIYEFIIFNKKIIKRTISMFSIFALVLIAITFTYLSEVKARVNYLNDANKKLLVVQAVNSLDIEQLKAAIGWQEEMIASPSMIDGKCPVTTCSEVKQTNYKYKHDDNSSQNVFELVAKDISFTPVYIEATFVNNLEVTHYEHEQTKENENQLEDFIINAEVIKEDLRISVKQGSIVSRDVCTEEYNISSPIGAFNVCIYEKENDDHKKYYITRNVKKDVFKDGNSLVYQFEFAGDFSRTDLEELADSFRLVEI